MRVPQVSAVVCITVLVFLQTGAVTATTTADCPSNCHGNWSRTGYEASWCYRGDEVHFCVSANTTGWIGIGFSSNRMMSQSDVVMGGTDANRNSFIYDSYAERRVRPPVDMKQNLECTSVTRKGNHVTMCFKRKKVTGDNRDFPLDKCQYFLFAWGGQVGNNPPQTLGRHQRRFVSQMQICPPTLETCPAPQCPAQGQEYFDGRCECVPCTGTCKEPAQVCTLECRSGCGCPVGTVLDEEANACVNVTDCPKPCREGDMTYQSGDTWNCSDGCNTCSCSDGRVRSTLKLCHPCVARPVTGPCLGYFPRYFYNTTSGKCEMFIYGGCQGNQNNFETLTECTKECALKLDGVCSLPAETGPCEGSFPRYFYNSTSMKCEEFIYGGCRGNENNFESEEDCQGCCGCPYEGMKYYDVAKDECAPCTGTCEEPLVPCPRICRSGCACRPGTVLHEGKCVDVAECPKADCREGDMTYKHGEAWLCSDGCNSCSCSDGLVRTTLKRCHPCVARPVTGPCKGAFPRYFYNTTSGKCEMFIYGGCKGNQNNFETLKECTKECALRLGGVCSLPADPGPCQAYIPRFFYNSTTMKCEQFIYGGCLGNENNYERKEDCLECCGCPYEGMRYYDVAKDECAPCTGTCEEPLVPCPRICRSGCACRPGTVLHKGKCIRLTECSKECPAQGQEYFDGVDTCVPCTGTCKEPNVSCIAECRSGCGCPVGTVLDEEANACVNVTDCPKEPCPEECSHSFCRKNGANANCSVPGSTGPACTGTCHVTLCRACYYSREVQTCPRSCSYSCGEDSSSNCFRKWSQCVKNGLTSGNKKANRFKCVDPCSCQAP